MKARLPNKALRLLALAFLIAMAAVTRFEAPFQADVIHDETLHFVGYDSQAEQQKFVDALSRLDAVMGPERRQHLQAAVQHSYALKRLPYAFVRDAHPPLFPLLAEASEFLMPSKLLPMRMLSVLVGLFFLSLCYCTGREYNSEGTAGLWFAGLASIGLVYRAYAGISRPYVYAQAAVVLILWAFLRRENRKQAAMTSFLGMALLVQFTDWMAWVTVAPLLLIVCIERYRAVRSLGSMLRESWWYILASLVLVVQCKIQLSNPVINSQFVRRSFVGFWYNVTIAMPFAEAGHFWVPWTNIGAITFLLLIVAGLVFLARDRNASANARYGLLAVMAINALFLVRAPQDVRFEIVPTTVFCLAAAIGAARILESIRISEVVLAALMALFLGLYMWRPEDLYARVLSGDTRYSAVAAEMKSAWRPGDAWYPLPESMASNLYLYGVPQPHEIKNRSYEQTLAPCRATQSCFVFTRSGIGLDPRMLGLTDFQASANVRVYTNGFVLIRVPHEAAR